METVSNIIIGFMLPLLIVFLAVLVGHKDNGRLTKEDYRVLKGEEG